MAITYQSEGAIATGSTSLSVAFPASIAVNDALIMVIGQKPSSANGGNVTTPTGWTLIGSALAQGGYGATLGADTGNTNLFVYRKTKVLGTESGNQAVTLGTSNSAWGIMMRLSGDTDRWSYDIATGSDSSAGNVSIAMSSDPGVASGDYIIGAMCIPTDVTTPSQFSSEAFSQSGITFGAVSEIGEPDSGTGNDIGGFLCRAAVTAGTSGGVPTMTATAGGTTTNVRGPGVFIRIRELPAVISGAGLSAIDDGIAMIEEGLQRIKAGVTGVVAGGGGFAVDAVEFNADRLERGGALSGVADSGDAIVSYWIKSTDVAGSTVFIGTTGNVHVNTAYEQFYNGAPGIYTLLSSAITDGNWHHVLCALRMSTSTIQLYVDGVNAATGTTIDGSPTTAHFDDIDWAMCDTLGGGNPLTADIAEFYFAPGQYLDISVSGNRDKFRTAGNKPVDLGSDGSMPTGVAPAVYLSVRPGDAASVFATNKGTGGNFTVVGTPAIAATSPSD